jgi:hypothetical protein
MAQYVISSLENQINSDKQTVSALQQQKIQMEHQFERSKRELELAGDRALATMEVPGPTILNLIRQSVELKSRFTQEKSNLESQIRNLERNIDLKEHQLRHLQNVAM